MSVRHIFIGDCRMGAAWTVSVLDPVSDDTAIAMARKCQFCSMHQPISRRESIETKDTIVCCGECAQKMDDPAIASMVKLMRLEPHWVETRN